MKKATIILSAITLIGLTSCTGNSISSFLWMGSRSTVSQSDLEKLQKKLNKVKAAVNAGNFVVARKEFNKVETDWKAVEVSVRVNSSNDYTAVVIHMDDIKQALYHKPLSREKAILSLHSLERRIEGFTAPEHSLKSRAKL